GELRQRLYQSRARHALPRCRPAAGRVRARARHGPIARETGRDLAAVRFANFVQPADMPYDTGLPNYRGFGNVIYDSGDYPAVLRRALEMSGWERLTKECLRARQEGRLLGVGLACYVELTGVGPVEGATIRADS